MRSFSFVFLLLASLLLVSSCRYPKCPIGSCHTRKVHKHGKTDYRGQPWYKKQNPSIGEKLPKATKDERPVHNNKSINRK